MYVYILRSKALPTKQYIGLTKNLKNRLSEHNQGKSKHTAKFKPWKIQTAVWFNDTKKAYQFEKYLKHGSGYAFMKRHF